MYDDKMNLFVLLCRKVLALKLGWRCNLKPYGSTHIYVRFNEHYISEYNFHIDYFYIILLSHSDTFFLHLHSNLLQSDNLPTLQVFGPVHYAIGSLSDAIKLLKV